MNSRAIAILAILACVFPSFAEEWVPVYVSQLSNFTMDSAFADPEDTADPANFAALPSDINTAIVDDLAAMLGDMPPLDTVFAALRIARGYKGEPCVPLPEFITAGKASECAKCDMFTMLCRKQGIPAKEVVLWNCPEADVRLGAEVWIEGRWHFFLPSEGFFFSKAESFDPDLSECSVPGLTRLRTDSSLLRYGFSLDDSFVPMPVLNPDMAQWVARDIAQTWPVMTRGLEMGWAFNIEMDFPKYPAGLVLGATDGSHEDMFGLREGDGTLRRNTQAPFIGLSGKKAAYHSFSFKNSPIGQYRIQYFFTDKTHTHNPGACPLKNADILDLQTRPGEWYVDVLVRDADALLTIDVLQTDQDAQVQPHALIDAISILPLKVKSSLSLAKEPPPKSETSEPFTPEYSALYGLFSRPYSAQTDLDRYSQPFPGENFDTLDGYLLEAMAGRCTEGLDPETFCLWMLSFVSQKMELSKAHTGAYSLDMGSGNCYFRSLAFCALCKRLGLPARPVALLDPGRSHVVSEVYYGDAWHQFDPTYGSIFYSRPTYDGTGVILSARELRTEPAAMDYCMRVNAEIWSATYVPTIEMIPMIPDYIPDNYGGTAGVPILPYLRDMIWNADSWGPEFGGRALSTPVSLNLGSRTPFSLGADNQNPYDSSVIYVGTCYNIGNINTFTVADYAPGKYRIHYSFYDKTKLRRPGVLALKGVSVLSLSAEAGQWDVEVYIYEKGASFLLDVLQDWQEYRNPTFKAVDSITVTPIETFKWTALPEAPIIDISKPVELAADYAGSVGDVSFQWYRDGMPILGAEDRVLELEPTSPVGITGKYTLEATDEAGTHETPPLQVAPDQVPALSKAWLSAVVGLIMILASGLMPGRRHRGKT